MLLLIKEYTSCRFMLQQAVYESWQEHQLGDPLSHLYTNMLHKLGQVTRDRLPSKCAALEDIDAVLTQQLAGYIARSGVPAIQTSASVAASQM